MNVARSGTPETARFLIASGADVNRAQRKGATPLHWAAMYNSADMLDTLLDAGADPAAKLSDSAENAGFTALDLARKYNHDLRSTHALARLETATKKANCDGYLVQPGDDEIRIVAANALGDAERWPEIARLNNLGHGSTYNYGQCLRLPGSKAEPAPAWQKAPGCDGYVVKRADRKLGDIAEKVLGDRRRWPEIARLNGLSREKPYWAGQCLKLPG